MTEPRLQFVQCLNPSGLHRMAYWEWGETANPRVLVCAHGLARQGRDFDTFAKTLTDHYRVVCPDVVGRGRSEWLGNAAHYQIPQYVADMVTLIARLNATQIDWVGTSMGGLIGIGLAAMQGSPMRRLVLNDVGPTIQFDSLQRIGTYLGNNMSFPSFDAGQDFLRSISASFGPHTDEQWHALSRPMLVEKDDGQFHLHYDPAIAQPFRLVTQEFAAAGEVALWAAYDQIRCPTFLLRGAESDLISSATAQAMSQRGPKAQRLDVPGVGHAPTLQNDDQICPLREFLLAP